MNKNYVLLILVILHSCTKDSNVVPTIDTITVSTDGQLDERIWNQSLAFDLPSTYTLHLLQNDEAVWMAIELGEKSGKYVDVYLHNDSIGTINLHASMQLGERMLAGNWNDTIPAWNWGNNYDWIANTIRYKEHNEKMLLMESIAPYQGFEFKISKSRILQNRLFIRLEIKDFTGTGENYIYPLLSKREDPGNWLNVSL